MKWLQVLVGKILTKPVCQEVCDEVQKRNEQAHTYLEDCIEGAVKRCEDKFTELKEDMRRGFTEVKELIKNGRS